MMSINDFVQKYKLKNKATNNIIIYQVLSSVSLNDIGVSLGDGPFESDIGIANLHPTKGTHWVLYINDNYFDSYGCVCPRKLSKFILKRCVHCLYSVYKIQGQTNKRYSYCASYCLYKIFLTKNRGIDFKSAVLNLY